VPTASRDAHAAGGNTCKKPHCIAAEHYNIVNFHKPVVEKTQLHTARYYFSM
jgi:hypothetical protein